MRFNSPLYFCSSCRGIVSSSSDLYFVEEVSKRGFCSEECIEKFYAPIFQHYENLEKKLRKKYNLEKENLNHLIQDVHIMEKLLKAPDEIYCLENDMEESVYSFHLKIETKNSAPSWVVIICLVFHGRPSFIFLVSATKDYGLRKEFCIGQKIEDIDSFLCEDISDIDLPFDIEEVTIDEGSNDSSTSLEQWAESEQLEEENTEKIEVSSEVLEMVEQKKSSLLANLLEQRSEADIPYENFHLYDQFTPLTLESPDEVYKYKDELGDEVLTYIKAHDKKGVSFFYFVLCLNLGEEYSDKGKALLPILTFPSLDGELSQVYRKGEKISGKLKN